jgi:ornithine carbamoyltransferase
MLATAPIANGLVNFTKPQQMLATLQSIAKIKSHHPGQRFSYQWASLNCLDTSQVTMFGT